MDRHYFSWIIVGHGILHIVHNGLDFPFLNKYPRLKKVEITRVEVRRVDGILIKDEVEDHVEDEARGPLQSCYGTMEEIEAQNVSPDTFFVDWVDLG